MTPAFEDRWRALGGADARARKAALAAEHRKVTFVIVRGYLGNFMLGNFVVVRQALRAPGLDAFIARNGAGASIADNVPRLVAQVRRRAPPGNRLVFLGHSKGGLEALTLLAGEPELAARTDAVILSQTPRGPSAVLESLLLGRYRDSLRGPKRVWAERSQRVALHGLGAAPGGRQLTSGPLATALTIIDGATRSFPVIQMASWSSRPTTWLDSFHERLGEIRPGCAHDGQYFLEDLIWPDIPHVLLPRVDHAQPVMGGHDFDAARYWLAMIATLLPFEQVDRSTLNL